jgi:hypothetical protein
MTKREEKRIARKMLKLLAAKDAGKQAYAEADKLLDELANEVALDLAVKLDDSGRVAKLVDQFAVKTIVWKPCGVRRFDVKVEQGAR